VSFQCSEIPASDSRQFRKYISKLCRYTMGGRHFDALIFAYWEGDRLKYAARTRSGFTPAVRKQLHQRFRGLEAPVCPFANLPEARPGPMSLEGR
jgi:hypothetical protein